MPFAKKPTTFLSSGRIPALDGLRAIAVTLVCVDHVIESKTPRSHHLEHEFAKAISDVGVDAFFVLSGFLITTMLCRELERSHDISLRTFYVRRALRIFPAFLAFLGFVALLSCVGQLQIPTRDWLAAFTYTMNFDPHPAWEVGHLWSLSIEEHFYLLWPPLMLMLPRRAAMYALVALLAVEPIARLVVLVEWPYAYNSVELWTFLRTDGIVAGCLLGLVSRETWGVKLLDAAARRWKLATLALAAALALEFLSGKLGVGISPSVVALALVSLIWRAVRTEPKFLNTRLFVTVGIGSYSIYLWQQVFLSPKVVWWTSLPVALVLVGLAAAASYHLIEKPFVRLKDRKAH